MKLKDLEASLIAGVCYLSSSFPLWVNDELKLSLRQSGYLVQLGLKVHKSPHNVQLLQTC